MGGREREGKRKLEERGREEWTKDMREKKRKKRYKQDTSRNKFVLSSSCPAPRSPEVRRRLVAPIDFQEAPPSASVLRRHPQAVLHSPPVHIPFHTVDVLVEKFPDTMVLSFDLHYAIVVKRWQKLIQPNCVVSNLRI